MYVYLGYPGVGYLGVEIDVVRYLLFYGYSFLQCRCQTTGVRPLALTTRETKDIISSGSITTIYNLPYIALCESCDVWRSFHENRVQKQSYLL